MRNLAFLLRDVSRLFAVNFERHEGGVNLSLAECRVLAYLQRHEGVSQARLAYLTDTDPMTLGRLLTRMEGDGLVERRNNPADRRSRALYLTPAAAPVLERIWKHSDRARARALQGVTAEERKQLLALLEQVHGNLAALLPDVADIASVQPSGRRKKSC